METLMVEMGVLQWTTAAVVYIAVGLVVGRVAVAFECEDDVVGSLSVAWPLVLVLVLVALCIIGPMAGVAMLLSMLGKAIRLGPSRYRYWREVRAERARQLEQAVAKRRRWYGVTDGPR